MEAFIFAANLIFVATYFVRDLLRLRLLSAVATACLVVYFSGQPQPMHSVVGWNLFFLGLNLLQVARLLAARRTETGPLRA